jgi:hypothetical protein
MEIALLLRHLNLGHRPVKERPELVASLPRPHLDAIGARLALNVGTPRLWIVDLFSEMNHLPRGKQPAVVIAPLHPLHKALDSPADIDRILHALILRLLQILLGLLPLYLLAARSRNWGARLFLSSSGLCGALCLG